MCLCFFIFLFRFLVRHYRNNYFAYFSSIKSEVFEVFLVASRSQISPGHCSLLLSLRVIFPALLALIDVVSFGQSDAGKIIFYGGIVPVFVFQIVFIIRDILLIILSAAEGEGFTYFLPFTFGGVRHIGVFAFGLMYKMLACRLMNYSSFVWRGS